jgi:hypothetical protein
MVAMMVSMILAGALVGSVRADETSARATAIAVARAEIVSGLRITREMLALDDGKPRRANRFPKPRERPCHESDPHPCRMIVVDLP